MKKGNYALCWAVNTLVVTFQKRFLGQKSTQQKHPHGHSAFFFFYIVVDFVIHWNESAMGLHVFPIPIPPPTSLSTRSLQVFPVHQVRALVSCIQPGLVICFTLDNIRFDAVLLKHSTLAFSQSLKDCSIPLCLFFCSAYSVIINIFLNSIYMC